MPQYSLKKIIKVLKKHGFKVTRKRGSHRMFVNQEGIMVPVSDHGHEQTIPIGTALAIISQSGIPRDEFLK